MAARDEDYDDDRKERRKLEPPKFATLDALQVVFGVAACMGGFFFIQGPAKNTAHLLFRLGIMGVGMVGLLVVTILKMNRPRRS